LRRLIVFLVKDERHGVTNLVFTWEDPRKAGYQGNTVESVTLDYDVEAVHSWPYGQARPEVCVGRAPNDSKHYKVFKNRNDRQSEGYKPVAGSAAVFGSWKHYLRLIHPEDLQEEEWNQELDRFERSSRLRRKKAQSVPPPKRKSRDEVAAWLAKKHLVADSGIREVWYLPQAAPPEEIRLLELSDWVAGTAPKVEAVDFGLDIEGVRFRLFVADITGEQFDQIRQNPSRLPSGWSLDGGTSWRRGA
jgi:hypothetical protein